MKKIDGSTTLIKLLVLQCLVVLCASQEFDFFYFVQQVCLCFRFLTPWMHLCGGLGSCLDGLGGRLGSRLAIFPCIFKWVILSYFTILCRQSVLGWKLKWRFRHNIWKKTIIVNLFMLFYSGRHHTAIRDGVVVIRPPESLLRISASTASGLTTLVANGLKTVIVKALWTNHW